MGEKGGGHKERELINPWRQVSAALCVAQRRSEMRNGAGR